MEKKILLTNWRGRLVDARNQNQWRHAIGSSLDDDDKEILNEGGIVSRPKGGYYVKLFAMDEENQLYSIIVSVESELPNLIASMGEVGFVTVLQ